MRYYLYLDKHRSTHHTKTVSDNIPTHSPPKYQTISSNFNFNFNHIQPHFHQGQGGQNVAASLPHTHTARTTTRSTYGTHYATNNPPSTEPSALHRTAPAPATRTTAPTPTPIARIDTYLRVYQTNTTRKDSIHVYLML